MDNSRCEYEILKQHIDHWMPCDEPVNSNDISPSLHSILFVYRQSTV